MYSRKAALFKTLKKRFYNLFKLHTFPLTIALWQRCVLGFHIQTSVASFSRHKTNQTVENG